MPENDRSAPGERSEPDAIECRTITAV